MTANRWWVRVAARWLARVDGVSGQLRLAMLVLTGLSTATLTLRQYGYGRYSLPLIGVTMAGMAVYTYLYTEGGVWNQMRRDKSDLATNWAGPGMRITNEIMARGAIAGLRGRELDQTERDAISSEVEAAWEKHRDGVELES